MRKRLFVAFLLFIPGSIPLFIACGMCFGVALMAPIGRLKLPGQ